NATLRVTAEGDAHASGTADCVLREGQRVTVRISYHAHVARLRIDFVGQAVLGREEVNSAEHGIVRIVRCCPATSIHGIPIAVGVLLQNDVRSGGDGELAGCARVGNERRLVEAKETAGEARHPHWTERKTFAAATR